MASDKSALFSSLPPFQMATFLRAAERRYESAHASLKFDLWRRVRTYSFDAMRELHNFHDAMRRRVPVLRCAEYVGYAVLASDARAVQLARRDLAGLDLSVVWSALWAICQEVATYVGSGAVLGGVVGGVGGAFFGGVGAVPGAIGGASVGAEIGGWLLGLLGIKCLVAYISKAVPEMAGEYGRGFAHAWRAGERDLTHTLDVATDMHRATEAFAHGHLLFVTAILSAIVLYLSRGALGRAQLYAEIARSRLGPGFARWVEANEAILLKHPRLQPVRIPTVAEKQVTASPKAPAPQERLVRRTGREKVTLIKADSTVEEVVNVPAAHDLPILNLQPDNEVVNQSAQALATARGDKLIQLGDLGVLKKGDTLTIIAHGSPDSLGGMSAQEVADLLKANGLSAKKIELVACETGRGCFAQDLATATGTKVTAPMFRVNVVEDIYGVPQVRDPITSELRSPGEFIVTKTPKAEKGVIDNFVQNLFWKPSK